MLGLLLFLILTNLCGFSQEQTKIRSTIKRAKQTLKQPNFHKKYVDDLLIAEALDMKESLISNPSQHEQR